MLRCVVCQIRHVIIITHGLTLNQSSHKRLSLTATAKAGFFANFYLKQKQKLTEAFLMDNTVHHDKKDQCFYIKIGTERAILRYRENPPGVIDMYSTVVPESFQGKGIAKQLAEKAFRYVVESKDLKMKLSCSYLQKYYSDNPLPEYKSRMVE